nr:efflux RND transporter periplasmic adaptor subunit [uncultured Pseudomonas sp.]
MGSKYRRPSILLAALAIVAMTGCKPKPEEAEAAAPLQVSVLTLQTHEMSVNDDLPARVAAVRSAEIRAQISGIVQRRLFDQGAEIAPGTVLFQINPAPFKAEVDSAAAALKRAEAASKRARVQTDRLSTLVSVEAISRQVFDDAVALREQADADVAQAKATLARRKLDVQFASVEAPIGGRIDQSLVSEGALVSATDTTPMARIQQIDQVYVDVRQPASMLHELREHVASAPKSSNVDILDGDGNPLNMRGRLLFSGVDVDAGTGDVLLRVLVNNPERRLLPGLYVQARIQRAHYAAALSVPEQAVIHAAGQTSVWVMDHQSKVQLVPVKLGELVAGRYRVASGLSAGQHVVIEGIERLRPAAQVAARPWQAAPHRELVGAVTR